MVRVGRAQHAATRTVKIDNNPYASRISDESVKLARTLQSIRSNNKKIFQRPSKQCCVKLDYMGVGIAAVHAWTY